MSSIEKMVILIIIGLIVVAALNPGSENLKISFGVNGLTEVRCIDGFQFVIGEGGQARQIVDDQGNGSRCPKAK